MQLAIIFIIGFAIWTFGWKFRKGGKARRFGFAIITVLIGAPILIIALLAERNISAALWTVLGALIAVAALWHEMFSPED